MNRPSSQRDRAMLEQALAQYTPLWEAWDEGEKPRRRSIDLYGELFVIERAVQFSCGGTDVR